MKMAVGSDLNSSRKYEEIRLTNGQNSYITSLPEDYAYGILGVFPVSN